MPHAKRLAPCSRPAGRRFLIMLLWAAAGTAPPAAAQEPDDSPAPVLRVARDQPRLDALRFASESTIAERPRSSRRTAGDESHRDAEDTSANAAPTSAAPTNAAPANAAPIADARPARIAADTASSDGWITRGSLRRNAPLSEPESEVDALPMRRPLPNDEDASVAAERATSADAPSSDADTRSSNDRSLIQQEQNEQFEADAPRADALEDPRGDGTSTEDYGWIEIVPESIGSEPIPAEEAEPVWADEPEQDASSDSEFDPPSEAEIRRPRELEVRRPRDPEATQPREMEVRRRSELEVHQQREPEISRRSEPEASQRNEPAPIITAAARRLERPIEQCLQYYYQRPENARERTPWGMLHAILPYGLDATIDAGPRRYNAIAWLAGNNPSRNLKLLTVSRSGRIEARTGVGLQGHQAQMLAILAQVGVPQNYPLHVNGRRFVVSDLVKAEMAACRAGEELTFTLIGLSHYLPTDTTWRAADGQHWDFERLIREELQQPVVGAACGGTHRLMGLSYALTQRRLEGLPEDGQWERAAIFINDFVEYAWRLQNRDGSFSTQWFEGREDNNDLDRKLQTSGHIMEWLVFNATEEQLQDERVDRGIAFLAGAMLSGRGNQWQVGPKGHALRAMSLYHRRVFESERPWMPPRTASTTGAPRR